ncbi:hypothetical protein [Cohnella massiliensis]|uniref:hypothetical protein n=1 Tax=Cohnella massiliensis TaxID=1816691 RepID=UPI0009BB3890|nr:hypothetical protein [Cohnella massiliensis]
MEIVYSCENGGDYTKERIEDEIRFWMSYRQPFRDMSEDKKQRIVEIVYPLLLSLLDWECPLTRLEQFEDEDVETILERLGN